MLRWAAAVASLLAAESADRSDIRVLRRDREALSGFLNPKPPNCTAGDQVVAVYAGTGQRQPAVVQSVNGDGTVTVDWFGSNPMHRVVAAGSVLKGQSPCGQLAADPVPVIRHLKRKKDPVPDAPATPPTSNPSNTTFFTSKKSDAAAPGVVHFLFLLNGRLSNIDIWKRWLAQAHAEGSYTITAHCKDEKACQWNGVFDVNGMQRVATTPTWYCHDLVTAMAALLQHALDPTKQPFKVSGPEKFVFISDSTLPVKPFHEVHQALTADENSDFCIFPRAQWGSANIDGHDALLVKHHQWLILSKAHARHFVDSWKPVDSRGVWQVWLLGGSWEGKERFVSPQHFYHPPRTNSCTDEWAFVATIFGAIEPKGDSRELPGFGGGPLYTKGPRADVTQGRCRTFTYWTDTDGHQFARLGATVHGDWGSRMSCYPRCTMRPAMFSKLGQDSLQAFRLSEFLFVRKFTESAGLPDYDRIVMR